MQSSFNAVSYSALVLLALAGGFAFAATCNRTKFPSLRGEGQQLYFYAAVFAVPLVIGARLLEIFVIYRLPTRLLDFTALIAEPFRDIPALSTGTIAFFLGPTIALLLNFTFYQEKRLSTWVVENYESRLSKFLDEALEKHKTVYIALRTNKVYVGWVWTTPKPQPRKSENEQHFSLVPVRSGYLTAEKLSTKFNNYYGSQFDSMQQEKEPGQEKLRMSDFQVYIPMSEVIVARWYSRSIDTSQFKKSP